MRLSWGKAGSLAPDWHVAVDVFSMRGIISTIALLNDLFIYMGIENAAGDKQWLIL